MISPIKLTPQMDIGTMANAINTTFMQIESENRTKVIKDENGVNKILLGKGQDGKYVLKVAKDGIDVLIATNDQLIFNSSQNIFKIVETNNTTVTVSGHGTFTSTPIVHGLDFTPGVIAYITQIPGSTSSGWSQLPFIFAVQPGAGSTTHAINAIAKSIVDDTNLTFYISHIDSSIGNGVWNITYYLLQETVN